jgi:hypothetical protein
MTVDYEAVVWVRVRYRAKFIEAMRACGNRWSMDRQNVTAVAWMLGERAVRYAAGRRSIDLSSVMQAAADVERYCALHARRKASASTRNHPTEDAPRLAGYWCTVITGTPESPDDATDVADTSE